MSASVPRGTRPPHPSAGVFATVKPHVAALQARRVRTTAGELGEMLATEGLSATPAGLDARPRDRRRRGQENSP